MLTTLIKLNLCRPFSVKKANAL